MRQILITFLLIVSITGCKPQEVLLMKENPPSVVTRETTETSNFSVTLNGEVTEEGFTATTERGFVYSDKNINPSVSDSKIQSGYGKGVYFVKLDNLTLNTKYYFKAYATNSKGTTYGEVKNFTTPTHPRDFTTKVVEVKSSITGRIWMDRNLGASQAATSPNDEKAFGDLYQWGKPSDGHQIRSSPTNFNLQSSTDLPINNKFYRYSYSPGVLTEDWRNPQNDNLWKGVNGINNPCPLGFRIPTIEEWTAEQLGFSFVAFASPLKLTIAGERWLGDIYNLNERGRYWSTSTSVTNAIYNDIPKGSNFGTSSGSAPRAYGFSVRCIKD